VSFLEWDKKINTTQSKAYATKSKGSGCEFIRPRRAGISFSLRGPEIRAVL
jgi:hypothetical protein